MKYLAIFGFTAILFALGAAIAVDKHLSADGVNYFMTILETRDFTYVDWARQFANYVSQAPLVMAVNLGATDISALIILFGASILVPWFLALSLSLFALRNEDKSALVFMMVSMVSINLGSDYILAGEHHVIALIAWPILFYHLRTSHLRWYDALILWTLLFLFSRLYQTAVISAGIFLLIALLRIVQSTSYKQKVVFLGAAFFSTMAIGVAAYSILYPTNPENKQSFLRAILSTLATPEALTAAAFTVLLSAGWFWKRRFIVWLSLMPVIGYLTYVAWTNHFLSASESFMYRTLTLTLLPVLMLDSVAICYWRRRRLDASIASVVAIFVAAMVAGNLYGTLQWADFKSQMAEVLVERSGLVPFETTDLKRSPLRWGWNNTQLSIVWSHGCVRSVVLNPLEVSGWQPPGPPQVFRLREYTCYIPAFLQYDPTLCSCNP